MSYISVPPTVTQTVTAYTVTKSTAVSTTAETDIWTFTIPANTWADGEIVEGAFLVRFVVNDGSARTFTPKWYLGGVAGTALTNTSLSNTTDRTVATRILLWREGSSVYTVTVNGQGVFPSRTSLLPDIAAGDWVALASGLTASWTPTFTGDIIIKQSVTPSASHASVSAQCVAGHAFKL